jgi:hypothetical protein
MREQASQQLRAVDNVTASQVAYWKKEHTEISVTEFKTIHILKSEMVSRPNRLRLFFGCAGCACLIGLLFGSNIYHGTGTKRLERYDVTNNATKPALEADFADVQKRRNYIHYFHSYISTLNFNCNKSIRLGNAGDGGWNMCVDESFRPVQPCLVYSFG